MKQTFRHLLQNGREGLGALIQKVGESLQDIGAPESIVSKMKIAIEEIVLNALTHGGGEKKNATVEITGSVSGQWIEVVIRDNTALFNLLKRVKPQSLDMKLDDRPVGGLGIYLVSQLMDDIGYCEDEGHNRITLRCKYAV